MADVLFETGKYALSQDAQLKLAKLSGHYSGPSWAEPRHRRLHRHHRDPDFNLKLSQQRAEAVRTS